MGMAFRWEELGDGTEDPGACASAPLARSGLPTAAVAQVSQLCNTSPFCRSVVWLISFWNLPEVVVNNKKKKKGPLATWFPSVHSECVLALPACGLPCSEIVPGEWFDDLTSQRDHKHHHCAPGTLKPDGFSLSSSVCSLGLEI